MIRETDIESKFTQLWREAGALVFKFVSPGQRAVPDRLVLWPGGRAEFVEFKAPGKKPTAAQLRMHERIRALGFRVRVIDNA